MFYITKYALTTGIIKTNDGKVENGDLYLPKCHIPIKAGYWHKSMKKAEKHVLFLAQEKAKRIKLRNKGLKAFIKALKEES